MNPQQSLEQTLVEQLTPLVAAKINVSDVKGAEELMQKVIKEYTPVLEVRTNNEPPVKLTSVHSEFQNILNQVNTKEPIFLTGPAGSGKSTIAEQIAKVLHLKFGSISVCAQTTKSDFLGYQDAHGNYVATEFRKRYEEGGLFLIDEIDAGNPNVLAVLNAALSNTVFSFPDKMVEKHTDFALITTANTLGKGSTTYVGRNQLDAATLDRFNFIYVDYCKKIEKSLTPSSHSSVLKTIYKIRNFVEKQKINIIVSTRSIIKIIKLLNAGYSVEDSLKCTILKTADDALYLKIKENCFE